MYGTWYASSCGCCLFWSARFTLQCLLPFFPTPPPLFTCAIFLARLIEQYWHVSIKGLFHTKRSCMVRDTHLPAVVVYSGRQDLPSNVSFLSSPPLPHSLLAPFFWRSLTLVPRSLLLNRTETLASQANHAKIATGLCAYFHICGRPNFFSTGTQRYSQTSINRTPVHSQRFWRLIGEVAVTEWDNMKTTGFCFTWCASLKTAGYVSCPNIIFQVCFLAIYCD